jgi:hypothetical protein
METRRADPFPGSARSRFVMRSDKAYAVLEDGKVKRVVVTEAGSGYSSAPKATIQGMEKVGLKVTIQFNKDFKKNGSIMSIEVE